MQKSAISLIFIAILLGGIILSVVLITESPEEELSENDQISFSERIVRIQLTLREIVKAGELPEGKSLMEATSIGGD